MIQRQVSLFIYPKPVPSQYHMTGSRWHICELALYLPETV
jgi:hypothetical protein